MMSKQGKRKPNVDVTKSKESLNRPSVFDRLGIKNKTSEYCRQWSLHGNCAYGKSCKYASTHTLISPSKRAANKDTDVKRSVKDDGKNRLHSTVVVRSGRSPDGEIDNWDQNDLEYADTDVLEKRRLQLQRELELQLKMDSGKDHRKDKKKLASSSSSSLSSSTSTRSSSSSGSSSSSSVRDSRRKKKGKGKRSSSSSSDMSIHVKKKSLKGDLKRDKIVNKKATYKKDDRMIKKHDIKKKGIINKKGLSPVKKSSGTPPIIGKSLTKVYPIGKHKSSPFRRDKNRSVSHDHQKERESKKGRSRSPRRARSRSMPRRGNRSPSKDSRAKLGDRSRPVSPKKRREHSIEKYDRRNERSRDHKNRSLERRKDEKERQERKDKFDFQKGRKDTRKGEIRKGREHDRGLEKPNKPMERLLPRPEERIAALAAINNDKGSGSGTKDKSKRRIGSLEREDYSDYNRSRSIDRYPDDRYEGVRDDPNLSPYPHREHGRYGSPYDLPRRSRDRGYPDDDRAHGEFIPERGEIERRPIRRDRSWEGRDARSIDRDRAATYHGHPPPGLPPHKDWEAEEYRGEWSGGVRDRHWQHHDQMGEWVDKEQDLDVWQTHPRNRPHEDFKRRIHDEPNKPPPPCVEPVPDNFSEISDDADDILNQDDMLEQQSQEKEKSETEEKEIIPKTEPIESQDNIKAAVTPQQSEPLPEEKSVQPLAALKDSDEDNLDFEEISDGELEEDRTKGLADVLGVDWSSLVSSRTARDKGDDKPRDPLPPAKLLTNIGISVEMAGQELADEVLKEASVDKLVHPVASIQVSKRREEERMRWLWRERNGRALHGRVELSARRALCGLAGTHIHAHNTHTHTHLATLHNQIRTLLART